MTTSQIKHELDILESRMKDAMQEKNHKLADELSKKYWTLVDMLEAA